MSLYTSDQGHDSIETAPFFVLVLAGGWTDGEFGKSTGLPRRNRARKTPETQVQVQRGRGS